MGAFREKFGNSLISTQAYARKCISVSELKMMNSLASLFSCEGFFNTCPLRILAPM